MKDAELLPGLITRAQSGFFTVRTREGEFVAQLRGRLMMERLDADVAAVGDRVQVRIMEDGSAAIEVVEEREGVLSRRAPGQDREQILVANPDQVVVVFACADPDPNFRLLDRLLVVTEREEIPTIICANKIDLVVPQSAREEFGEYQGLGYEIFYTSAVTGEGVKAIRQALVSRISVFAGPSGAGKSSLLNAIQPGLELRTREVSAYTGKGKHTTVVPGLVPLEAGGYVADTPGLKAFALWDIEPNELDGYFREIRPLVSACDFNDCTHFHEPGCAVIEAVRAGKISLERYESYLRMRTGIEESGQFW